MRLNRQYTIYHYNLKYFKNIEQTEILKDSPVLIETIHNVKVPIPKEYYLDLINQLIAQLESKKKETQIILKKTYQEGKAAYFQDHFQKYTTKFGKVKGILCYLGETITNTHLTLKRRKFTKKKWENPAAQQELLEWYPEGSLLFFKTFGRNLKIN